MAALARHLRYAGFLFSALIVFGCSRGQDGVVSAFRPGAGLEVVKDDHVGTITLFDLPNCTPDCQPDGITVGSDGNIWFVDFGTDLAGYITTNGDITELSVKGLVGQLYAITTGPDANLWLTAGGSNTNGQVIKMTTLGATTVYTMPTQNSGPVSIAAGPDGNLWVADANNAMIDRVSTSGHFTLFKVRPPVKGYPVYPNQIGRGIVGDMWFTSSEHLPTGETVQVCKITRYGRITEYPVPANGGSTGQGIAEGAKGPNGNMWFAYGNMIEKITSAGQLTGYSTPYSNAWTDGIAAGPKNNLWYTDITNGRIGMINPADPTNQIEYPLPIISSPHNIVEGPDQNMWFVVNAGFNGYIGRITTH